MEYMMEHRKEEATRRQRMLFTEFVDGFRGERLQQFAIDGITARIC